MFVTLRAASLFSPMWQNLSPAIEKLSLASRWKKRVEPKKTLRAGPIGKTRGVACSSRVLVVMYEQKLREHGLAGFARINLSFSNAT